MNEVIRHIPTVCYLEVPGTLMPRRIEFERDRCRVMAVASTFYGTLDEQGRWHDNGEPRDKWWAKQIDGEGGVLAVWEAQGWDSRLALRFDWFEDQRLPAGTQAAFSNAIARRIGQRIADEGGTLDLVFADNEEGLPSAQLNRAFGELRTFAATWGNWNHFSRKARSWWGLSVRPAVRAGIVQTYEVVNDEALAVLCEAIRIEGDDCICWLPCLNQQSHAWAMVDEDTSHAYTERVILYAMARGCTRFGLHLPQIKDALGAWDLGRWHRYIDHVDLVIKRGDKMTGRAG